METLSDKIGDMIYDLEWEYFEEGNMLQVKDVKKFIKDERELLQEVIDLKITWLDFLDKRAKLAGDKLNG